MNRCTQSIHGHIFFGRTDFELVIHTHRYTHITPGRRFPNLIELRRLWWAARWPQPKKLMCERRAIMPEVHRERSPETVKLPVFFWLRWRIAQALVFRWFTIFSPCCFAEEISWCKGDLTLLPGFVQGPGVMFWDLHSVFSSTLDQIQHSNKF